ncbi:LysR family transcriptional regulator [Burkholderia sp. Bp9002]|nr:LysR family transcriptional regulator [Burkholderia sp. Bp9002]
MFECSLKKAAERLDVSVSEVSRQIRKLEAENEASAIWREPSGVVPTREAELFLEYHRSCESQF